jgi:hypothetical protein
MSMGIDAGWTIRLRLLIKMVATVLAATATIPTRRNDQASPTFLIIAPVPRENMRPPIPEPAALISLARLRFKENH